MIRLVSRSPYHIPGLQQAAEGLVRNCRACALTNAGSSKLHGVYMPIFSHITLQPGIHSQIMCLSKLTKCWQLLSFACGKSLKECI